MIHYWSNALLWISSGFLKIEHTGNEFIWFLDIEYLNKVKEFRELWVEYNIEEEDEEIAALSKEKWKATVYSKVYKSKCDKSQLLNHEKNQQLKFSSYPGCKTSRRV